MQHTLIDEALPDIAVGRRFGERLVADLGFLSLTLVVGQGGIDMQGDSVLVDCAPFKGKFRRIG